MSATDTFRQLHGAGIFLLPNAWDAGSARYLEWRGVDAVATTSSGFAATLGRHDQNVSRDELLRHAEQLAGAISIPLSVDSERCYADDPEGVAETVRLLAATGAAGCSIEDYDPASDAIDPMPLAVERTEAAATEAARHGLVLTARAENHLYGVDDLDDTIARLVAFREAGAEVLYAPGLTDLDQIASVVAKVGAPVNVLATPRGPSVEALGSVGVRRVSTGGALAWAALGGLRDAVDELLADGTSGYLARALRGADRNAAFDR
ncbi:MAG: isocitrate lyase/phosphoenolpyruvate mutase family protein [Actinomycetota bacterium]